MGKNRPASETFQRIMIIGGPGSGKTWLAECLGRGLDLPVRHVDDALHEVDGRLRAPETIDAIVRSWIAETKWIIEGGGSRTYLERARRADLVVRLRPPVWLRLYRVLRRDGARLSRIRSTLNYDRTFGGKDAQAERETRGRALQIVRPAEIEALLRAVGLA